MQRRSLLLGLLLAAPAAPAEAQVFVQPGPPVYAVPPRRRRRRCRLVQVQEPVVDRFGRVRFYRTVTREICR